VRRKILETVEAAQEFFTEKKVLLWGGGTSPRAIVALRRQGRTSAGNGTYQRVELWRFEKATPRWEVSARVYLCRRVFPEGARPAWPELVVLRKLPGVTITNETTTLPGCAQIARAVASGGPP
jgi:hypothetical protein